MIIQNLNQKFGDEVALLPNHSFDSITNEITENRELTHKVIVPEKFRVDVEALERYIDSGLTSGICITVSLSELLTICPRVRRRIDSYAGLVKFLREEMNVTLTIKSKKN